MPAAYRAAGGEGVSRELVLLNMVERFGAQAILGHGTLYSYEIRGMMLAERIQRAYEARGKALNWATWAGDNPELAELLAQAESMALGDGDG